VDLAGSPREAGNAVGADGLIREVRAPLLHLVRTARSRPKGTVVLLPGGGYNVLSARSEGLDTARFLNQCGYDAAILEYRIAAGPDTRTRALQDGLAAWRLVRARRQDLGLRGERLALMGYSAGGHLAARVVQSLAAGGEAQPDDLILVYPAYLDACRDGSVWPEVLPPAVPRGRLFLLMARDDDAAWTRSAEIFAKTWRGYGGDATLHLLPGGGHGFGMDGNLPEGARPWPKLLAAFLEAHPAPAGGPNPAAVAEPSPSERHDRKVAEALASDHDLILIGDSITHNLERPEYQAVWARHFAPRRALDLGTSGYRTENILWNLQNGELKGRAPKVFTLMVGTNNVDEKNYPVRHTAPQVAGGIRAILDLLRTTCPESKIILLRPFPGSYDGPLPTSHRLILERTGDLIRSFADDRHIFYCDVNAAFLDARGAVDARLLPDYLHPSPEGAERWAQAMEPLLTRLLGEPQAPASSQGNPALRPVPGFEEDGYDWMARHREILDTQAEIDPDLVFLGDSITHAWGGRPRSGARSTGAKVLAGAFPGHRVLNLGFGWDRTQNVLWRLEHGELDGLHPTRVVVAIGTNNTSTTNQARATSPEETAQGVEAVVRKVQALAPQARVVLMALFPREHQPDHPRRLLVNAINQRLAALPGVTFLDLSSRFLTGDGLTRRDLLYDDCHPTEAGYRIWAEALAPVITR
jgi:lysophospholipase L1-like esterase/acetyl esterase/lipase